MLRIGRIFALGLALTITPVLAAQADDVGGAEISVPAETTVIVEEVVTAPPPAFVDLSSTSDWRRSWHQLGRRNALL